MIRALTLAAVIAACALADDPKPAQFQIGGESEPAPAPKPNAANRPKNLLPNGMLQPYKDPQFQVQAPTIDRAARTVRPKRQAQWGQRHQFKRQYEQNPYAPTPVAVAPAPTPNAGISKKKQGYDEPAPPPPPPAAPATPAPSYPEDQPASPPKGSGGPGDDQSDATRYYYPPRFPLPLAKCFHNPTGYVCCNADLNDLMVQAFTDLEARPKFHTCNIQKLANELQDRAQKMFNQTFETVVSFEDFAQKIHFRGDLVCKVELGGRYMLAYSSVSGVKEANLPPVEAQQPHGPVEEHHISRRHSVRMYPKNPVPIRQRRNNNALVNPNAANFAVLRKQ